MFLIKSRIRFAIGVCIMTVFVFITYDNLQNIQAERSLPLGVTEIELTNWTKTREPEEIGDGEKKMNSHSDRAELNEGISSEEVESIDGLYKREKEDSKYYLKLRAIKDVSSSTNESADKSENEVSGNKVLRTIVNSGLEKDLISYSINDLYGYLKSDRPIKWDNEGKITWDLHTCVDPKNEVSSIEWRMLSASFKIEFEQKKLLEEGKAYAVLGIPADNKYGFELIMPYNDLASVFLNQKTTNINFETRHVLKKQRLNSTDIEYKNDIFYTCSSKNYHNSLSQHTDGYHVDMRTLSESAGKIKGSPLEMDLKEKLNIGENTIDILIGNFITSDNLKNNSCGFSKINLYIIEKPQMDISMKLYKYKNGQVVYFDEDYCPTKGDKVYVRIDIQNNSKIYTLKNINFRKLNGMILDPSTSKYIKINGSIDLDISPDSFIYNGNTITDDIRCYKNGDTSEEYDINALKSLESGGKLTIMSDSLKYIVSNTDIINNGVICVGSVRCNYIQDDLEFLNVEKDMKIPISKECGILNIKCTIQNDSQDSNNEEAFLMSISSDKGFTNLSISPGNTYTVKNLNIDEWQYINLVAPQDYEVIDTTTYSSSIQNKIFLKQQSIKNYTGNIEIKLKKKNNPYFYKNKQGKININVLDKSKDL